jgi:hypothetical protein
MWTRVSRAGVVVVFLALIGAGSGSLALLPGLQSVDGQPVSPEAIGQRSNGLAKIEGPPAEQPKTEVKQNLPAQSNLQATGQPQRPDAAPPSAVEPSGGEESEPSYYVPGNVVTLKPTTSFEISADDSIQFTAILSNQGDAALSLTGELIVIKGDGTTATLLPSRGLKLKAGQKIQLPVEFAVKSWHFPPGKTEFLAILRDLQGEIIDRASVTFQISVVLQQ